MPLHGHITTIPAQMTNEDCKTLGEQQLLTVICVFFVFFRISYCR